MITPRNVLLIDIDKPYDHFIEYIKPFWVEHLHLILDKFGLKAVSIDYKRSTNGNTHIIVRLDKQISYRTMLHLMLALGCDLNLISISLMRLESFGDPLVKQFNIKMRKKASICLL